MDTAHQQTSGSDAYTKGKRGTQWTSRRDFSRVDCSSRYVARSYSHLSNLSFRHSKLYSCRHPQPKMRRMCQTTVDEDKKLSGTGRHDNQAMQKSMGWTIRLPRVPSHTLPCRCATIFCLSAWLTFPSSTLHLRTPITGCFTMLGLITKSFTTSSSTISRLTQPHKRKKCQQGFSNGGTSTFLVSYSSPQPSIKNIF